MVAVMGLIIVLLSVFNNNMLPERKPVDFGTILSLYRQQNKMFVSIYPISITNGNVSNLRRHLNRKHLYVILSRCNPIFARPIIELSLEVNLSTDIQPGVGLNG